MSKWLHFWRDVKATKLLNQLRLPAALCSAPNPPCKSLYEPAAPQPLF